MYHKLNTKLLNLLSSFYFSNIAEALISKGLATVIRHRADDDQRSSVYDELLSAEARAVKNSKGLHSKKEYPLHRVADISGVSKNHMVYV